MSNHFSYRTCDRCGKRHDPTATLCPQCKREFHFEDENLFVPDVHVGWLKNLIFFLVGFVGFQILGSILSTIFQTAFTGEWLSAHPGATKEELQAALIEYVRTGSYILLVNGIAYGLLIIAMFVILGKGIGELLRGWKGWKPYVAGLIGFAVVIGLNMGWGLIMNIIHPNTDPNNNQNAINTVIAAYPVLSILLFGIVGPVCEEFTYRIGLFSLSKRISRVFAYIVTPLVFGFIHFDWNVLLGGWSEALAIELLNIPSYVLAGVALSFIYDKFGIGAAMIAHIGNNLIGIIPSALPH